MVFILLLVITVMYLTSLQASRENRGLQPFCKRNKNTYIEGLFAILIPSPLHSSKHPTLQFKKGLNVSKRKYTSIPAKFARLNTEHQRSLSEMQRLGTALF